MRMDKVDKTHETSKTNPVLLACMAAGQGWKQAKGQINKQKHARKRNQKAGKAEQSRTRGQIKRQNTNSKHCAAMIKKNKI